jgi:hypothetical protein
MPSIEEQTLVAREKKWHCEFGFFWIGCFQTSLEVHLTWGGRVIQSRIFSMSLDFKCPFGFFLSSK